MDLNFNFNRSLIYRLEYKSKFELNINKTDIMKKGRFMEKYGMWLFVGGLVAIFIILKLIGFPEILSQ